MSTFITRFAVVIFVFLLFSCGPKDATDEHSPQTSLSDLKVYPGLDIDLFAAEPVFSNPTNIAVDARGRVWVCEAYNYRNSLNPKNPVKKEGDRIMILEDTDGDGKADKSKIFYQGPDVNAALGICVLGNRIFVSCSPNVFVFTDENGDDVPDKKEVLFTGISGGDHDHGMHAFTFGPDGRLYFNMGNAGEQILLPSGDTLTDIHGRKIVNNGKPFREGLAFRCDQDGSNVEVLGHNFRNNYELTVDPYGTIWQSDNDDDGNKGTRINYVMEQGNFGYTDEITGAGWSSRRTNMEKEVPLRHWHLNDPGVVPNILQTGSGSPCGITMYEGEMLPEVFQGQVIHAEAGHNVVRAYPVENDGAGYKGSIVNLVEGQQDQWFRPVDVTAAPDGSLFIADWYDPGVGGHQVIDLDRGRIYRLTSNETNYKVPSIDLKTPQGAVKALLNPNTDIRYQGWNALAEFGKGAEQELLALWKSNNPRHRAQAFWLLIQLKGKGDQYVNEAVNDKDPNLRITAIRAARQRNMDVLNIAARLVNDLSPQVRREVAIALRGKNSPLAASLWAQLASQHDGKDRWYLEALGIGAFGNEDLYFNTWKNSAGSKWNSAVGKDIVWRSRSKDAIPLLADLIRSSPETEMLRYFRAFDFHTHNSKQQALAQLAVQSSGKKVLFALKHMNVRDLKITPQLQTKLNQTLEEYKGTLEFVEIASAFKLQNKVPDLLGLAIALPDSTAGKEAAKVLLNWKQAGLFEKIFDSDDKEKSEAVIRALWSHMYNRDARAVMEKMITDSTKDIELRKLAVRTFRGPWIAEDRLLELAKDGKIPNDLHIAAAGVFQTAWRSNIREEAAKYIKLPGNKEGVSLPSISVLSEKTGDHLKGKEVFKTLCANCHQVNKEGVNFGPDLSEIGDKLSKEALYTSILYPDQGISFGYEAWRIKLKDGSSAFGRIVSETEDKIELQYIDTKQTVTKSDVASRSQLSSSLMPADLQASMSEKELIDLVEYLQTLSVKTVQ